MNLAYGWCAVVALGPFDAQRGGHLVLHDLRVVVPFPHGSCILIPSAFLWHSNVPVPRDQGRASLTFYTPGGLFRFIRNDFRTEASLVDSLVKVDRELHDQDKQRGAKFGAALYSKFTEIKNPSQAELNPILF
ncbi:hypothetical protein AGABI2DRAFT_215625 [Agaricus bisporus var. bisporus H97]|uniref:hypothetical protein n=1 Tax=Agaricus bisporus var. bisporus (strain H97 / ATCC MYA-4626 / FGSC 10389) TaxID=936046 RepID=UPI00029F7681|nr:hypothetical protein AGABI2DRAFT_215625 [Agaricus bisporus var. bisporus H97]EKV49672.1 hypothetical protein AGABI2DRAFT_215625 [Agaricus bisporus var. bisporus H97]